MESREQLENEAAAWLFKRDAGVWTESDQQELSAWLQASSARRVVFLRLDNAWSEASRLKALGAGLPSGQAPWTEASEPQSVVTPPVARPKSTSYWRGALAASLVLVVFAATWALLPQRSTYRTEVGGMQRVALADGSRITLNTDSEVRVAFVEHERRIQLQRGEVFFEVAKDRSRPFVVIAGERRVVAVGTSFSVRREKEDISVIVSEGQVRMEQSAGAAEQPVALLSAGSIARSDHQSVLVQKKPLSDVTQYLSWRTGFLVFQGTPLSDAAAEFNRYNDDKIVIGNSTLAGMKIDGNFRSNNVDAFVRLLGQNFPVVVERRGRDIYLQDP
ncbi:FecR family protein [Steroidobacter sp.]|uniref:FecR family protein n=1 Tax=Steroidobacter sp. TaxID=1978227 RepID=UPI001A5628E8|nr:FecR domain-containing protein [Steroidobacter sp.]MBL8265617.1 FecR domain-containing protein [Steroidobacter sp.]